MGEDAGEWTPQDHFCVDFPGCSSMADKMEAHELNYHHVVKSQQVLLVPLGAQGAFRDRAASKDRQTFEV